MLKLTDKPLEIVKELSKIGEDARNATLPGGVGTFKETWAENQKHLSGLLLDATRDTLRKVSGGYSHGMNLGESSTPSAEPVAVNLILPRAQRFIARHQNLMGGVKVAPATTEPEDKKQAKAAGRLMQAMWADGGLDVVAMKALVSLLATEHGFVLMEGDPKAELSHVQREDGGWDVFDRGGVLWANVPTQLLTAYPGIADIHESPAIIVEQFLTPEYLKRRWGIKAPEESSLASYGNGDLDSLEPQLDKVRYRVKRLFIKPSRTRRLGEHHVFIGEKLVHSSKVDGEKTIGTYDFKYPIIDFREAPLSFGFWGVGRQTAARTIVKILCANWSRMVQCSIGMPGIIVDLPEGSDIEEEGLGNRGYEVVRRNAQGTPIGFNAIPGMPLHQTVIELCIRWLDEIYAQSPSSRGKSPGSRFAAKGLEFLAQQDVLADTPTGKMVLKAMHALFRRALGEGLRVWDKEHVAHILGEGRELETIALHKGSLKQGWDIFVMPGQGRLTSPEGQRGEINKSFELGLLKGPEARKLAGYFVEEEVFEPMRAQERIIELEEEGFRNGQPAQTNPFDDHQFHIGEHDKIGATRFGLPDIHPLENARRQAHNSLHLQALDAKNQALLADQTAQQMEEQVLGGTLDQAQQEQGGPPLEEGVTEPPQPEENVSFP